MCRILMLFVLAALLLTPAATAEVITLDFEGLQNLEPISNFYNGGTGGLGSGPGANYGISFGIDSLALIDADAGGNGQFANEPSPSTIAIFLTGPGVVMNVPGGFTDGFSFNYTTTSFAGTVDVYEGLDATGNLLGSLTLAALGSVCNGDPTGSFNCWASAGVTFSGIARSVNFAAVANQSGFDNITLGSSIPNSDIPEPASFVLLASAAAVLLLLRRRAA